MPFWHVSFVSVPLRVFYFLACIQLALNTSARVSYRSEDISSP